MSIVLCGAAFNAGKTALDWICGEIGDSVLGALMGGGSLATGG